MAMFGLLGLAPVQEDVYRAALDWPGLSCDELADKLGLTADQVRSALTALRDLRIMRESCEEQGRLFAVDPLVGLQELLAREQEQLMGRQRKIAAGRAVVLRMLAEKSMDPGVAPEAGGGVGRLLGMDAVQQRLERLGQEARRSVMTFMPGGAQSAVALEAARRNDERALERGVAIRTVGLDSIRQDERTLEYARWITDRGGEFRTVQELPPRMILVDRRVGLLPIDPEDTRKGALLLSEPSVVSCLAALFEQVWEVAIPLGADRCPGHQGLLPREKRLLSLIAQGHTDESAAGALFISSRTARRMMASIMERLGARSRFEAGVRAAQIGWLQ
jgi:DNA-binding CsgD family transcriptional regulator/DNA-binding transcriptional ArsR family regulator